MAITYKSTASSTASVAVNLALTTPNGMPGGETARIQLEEELFDYIRKEIIPACHTHLESEQIQYRWVEMQFSLGQEEGYIFSIQGMLGIRSEKSPDELRHPVEKELKNYLGLKIDQIFRRLQEAHSTVSV